MGVLLTIRGITTIRECAIWRNYVAGVLYKLWILGAPQSHGRWFVLSSCYDESAMSQHDSPDDSLRRRWVETWHRAGEELASLRRIELESVDTQEAVRQIFGGDGPALPAPSSTSGLVEQQAWFARMQRARRKQ
jgi:hypothetical protein